MAWIQTPVAPVTLPAAKVATAKNSTDEDTNMDEGDAMAASSPGHTISGGQEQQENIDYDVADDNDWGVQ